MVSNNSEPHEKKNYVMGVHCDVNNCEYNDKHCNCYADKIIVGPVYAANTSDTVCSTFKADNNI
jgi:hypothetical protein